MNISQINEVLDSDTKGTLLYWFMGLPLALQLLLVISTPIPFFMYYFIKNEEFRKTILNIKRPKRIKLRKHKLVSSKPYYKHLVNSIDFYFHIKTLIFKIILERTYTAIIDNTKIWIDEMEDKKDNDSDVLLSDMTDNINNILDQCELDIKNDFDNIFEGEDAEKAYELAYQSHFRKDFNKSIAFLLKCSDSISRSSLKRGSSILVYLNILQTTLDVSILNCEERFKDVNGTFETFKLQKEYSNYITKNLSL